MTKRVIGAVMVALFLCGLLVGGCKSSGGSGKDMSPLPAKEGMLKGGPPPGKLKTEGK